MKDHPPFPFDDPSEERFIDASLREHVRVGSSPEDDELVRSILVATVEKQKSPGVPTTMKSQERKFWLAGVASAAAILAALATLLAVLPFRNSNREVEEIRFIVQYGPSNEGQIVSSFAAAAPQREPEPFSGSIEVNVDHGPPISTEPRIGEPAAIDLAFEPSFSEVPAPATREDRMQISADKTTKDGDYRIYEGNVIVQHEDFHLTADRVELSSPSRGELAVEISLVSTNALLEQTSPSRTALARELQYEPLVNRFTLSGVTFLDSAQGRLSSFADDDLVYLVGETFVVKKSTQP
ncbi:MAG: LptA/OstA family protein [Verrucomicrobiota bacterium]